MIGVTFAVPEESRDFLRALCDRKETTIGNAKVIAGTVRGKPVAILHTGVGSKVCAERIGPFLSAHPLEAVISCGFAGGIAETLAVGNLLLAENFSDEKLLARVRDALRAHAAKSGKLETLPAVIESAAERAELARETQADAVDMETRIIHEACAARHIPMLSLRAISDTAAAPFPAPADVLFDLARQKTHGPTLAAYLLRHPQQILALLAFARRIGQARQGLTAALLDLISTLC